ncbi:MAG: hypothetical protein GXZ04_02350 [Clostridiales bacterium]|nr:hypothetical protein [Clostridiales bacterium]
MVDKTKLTSAQAVYVAARMEQRAVNLYERAQMVFALGEMKPVIEGLLHEERAHLDTFQRLQKMEGQVAPDDAQILDAEAENVPFTGGLMGAVREGAFDSILSLLIYAADEEERAMAFYRAQAQTAQGDTRETFLLIARQEQRHLERLQQQISQLQEDMNA